MPDYINKKNEGISVFILLLIFLSMFIKPSFAEDKALGMVLDIKGKVKIKRNSSIKAANIMQPLYDNSIVYTGENSEMTFVNYGNNNEYIIGSDSHIVFQKGKAEVKKGSFDKIEKGAKIPLPKNTVLISRKITGEVHLYKILYGLNISHPTDKMLLASKDISFWWNGGETEKYRVVIIEAGTRKIVEPFPIIVKGRTFKFSDKNIAPFKLEYGKEYFFTVQEVASKATVKKYGKNCVYEDIAKVSFTMLPEDRAKQVIQAEKTYREAIKKNPNDKKSMLLMADLYKENGMFEQALGVLRQLQYKDPRNPYVYYYIANVYDELKMPGTEEMRKKGRDLEVFSRKMTR